MSIGANVFVTGGAGFIGSHTCKALAQLGFTPVVFDDLSTGHLDCVRWGPFEKGSIADRPALEDAISRHRPVAVIHFAASALVGESTRAPGAYYLNNVVGTLNLLEALRATSGVPLVFSSSCATYGEPEAVPISEDAAQAPLNPYGRSKLVCEQMIRDFSSAHGLRFVGLRYFNAAGADPDGELAERHDPETHLVPLAIMAALGMTGVLEMFGTDYPTPDGTCVRDYVHVSDLAQAHALALSHLLAGRSSMFLNLGAGQGTSVQQVVDRVGRLLGTPVPVRVRDRRPGDPAVLVADIRRAQAVLGFAPRLSNLDTIIATAAKSLGEAPSRKLPSANGASVRGLGLRDPVRVGQRSGASHTPDPPDGKGTDL